MEGGFFQTHFRRSALPWYKSREGHHKKKKNYRSISLMNIDAKILRKILTSWIQQQQGSYIVIKWYLFQGCKDGSISINQSMWYTIIKKIRNKNQNHLNRCRKTFWWNSTSTYGKNFKQNTYRGNVLQHNKDDNDKPTANIVLNDGSDIKSIGN